MRLVVPILLAATLAQWPGPGGPFANAQESKVAPKVSEWTDARLEQTDPEKLFDIGKSYALGKDVPKNPDLPPGCSNLRTDARLGRPATLAGFIDTRPRMGTGRSTGTRSPSQRETNRPILRWDRFTIIGGLYPAIISLRAIIF